MVGRVTANQGKVVRPSQLIRSVRPTLARMEPPYGKPVGPTATAG